MARLFRTSASACYRYMRLHFRSGVKFCRSRSLGDSRLTVTAPVAADDMVERSTRAGCLEISCRKPANNSTRYFLLPSRLQWVTSVRGAGIQKCSPSCFAGHTVQLSQYSTGVDSKPKTPEEREEDSIYQRFKRISKEHGKVLLAVHLATSTVWYSLFFAFVKSGVDVVPWMDSWGGEASALGEFALAYIIYRVVAPLRYAVTVVGANLVVRHRQSKKKIVPKTQEDHSLSQLRQQLKVEKKLAKRMKKLNGMCR